MRTVKKAVMKVVLRLFEDFETDRHEKSKRIMAQPEYRLDSHWVCTPLITKYGCVLGATTVTIGILTNSTIGS